MNNEYKKKYLKYKKKYLQFKQLRGGAAGAEVDLRLEIDLAGGLFFALSSSLFLDTFYNPSVNYILDIKDITDFFKDQLESMKEWHRSTGGEEEIEEISGFPWNNADTFIKELEKVPDAPNYIIELLIEECNEIGDLDTKLHANLSDIEGFLVGQAFPSYAAMFFLAREKCGALKIDEIWAFLKKKGEKTDLGASVLDRTFLSKLIHSDKSVLKKICWELIFIILKNEPGKIEKRVRRFIIFYFIFNKNIFTINSIDDLLVMCISYQSPNNWDTNLGLGKPPPILLSHESLQEKITLQVVAIKTTVQNLDTFNMTDTEGNGSGSGWTRWEALKTQYFPHIFPEIFDSSSEGFIKQKLDNVGMGGWVVFAIKGFIIIKQLIKDQTTLNSLLLTSFNGFDGNGLPYQKLAQNIKIILEKMNTFLHEGGATVPYPVSLTIQNFTDKARYIEIAKAIKNVIVNLATDFDMAKLSEHMKDFYIEKFNLTEPIEGPSGFSWARVQVPMNLENITQELMEKIALLKLSINKLTIKNPSRQNITEAQTKAQSVDFLAFLRSLNYRIPTPASSIEEPEEGVVTISDNKAVQILAGWLEDNQTVMEEEAEIIMQHMGYTPDEQIEMLDQFESLHYTPDEKIEMLDQFESLHYTPEEQIALLHNLNMLYYTLEEQIALLQQWASRGPPFPQPEDVPRKKQNRILSSDKY